MSEFSVGQKVVCVDDTPHKITATNGGLRKNDIYTVSAINVTPNGGILICELWPTPHRAFRNARFRPFESKAIQLFRKIAADATSKRKITVVEPDRVRARAAHNEER